MNCSVLTLGKKRTHRGREGEGEGKGKGKEKGNGREREGERKEDEEEAQKAKWKMKAAKDAGGEYYDPTRGGNIQGRNKTTLALWEEHLKDPIVALDEALKCVRGLRPSAWWKECLAMAGVGFFQSVWEKPIWEGVWLHLDPMDGVCLRTASMEWNVSGKYGPHSELFFFLIQKEPATMLGSETSLPLLRC